MTMRTSRLLPAALLALTVACVACAVPETGPIEAPPRAEAQPEPFRRGPGGVQYLAPRLALGPEGDVYLSWLAVEYTKSWDVLLSRSEDFGATWSAPRSLKPDKGTIAGGIRLATDHRGHVYVVWRDRDHVTKKRQIIFTRSRDRGMHWDEAGRSLSASYDLFYPHILAEPRGQVYVGWLDGGEDHRWLDVTRSSDAGATFQNPPSRLAAAFGKSMFGISRVRFASDGEGHLYVVWEEAKTPFDFRIYLNRSLDGGKTWASEPVLLNVPEPRRSGGRNPQLLAASDGRVYVAWEQSESRKPHPGGQIVVDDTDVMIYFNRSTDFGASWLPQPIRLNEAGPDRVRALNVELSGGRDGSVYAIWIEAEGEHPKRLLFARSIDSGLTWDATRTRLDLTSPYRTRVGAPEIQSDETGHVWVLWQELAPWPTGWQALINRSDDHGKSWRKTATPLATPPQRKGSLRGVAFQTDRRGRVYVAWDGGNQSVEEIYFNRSTDFGATWLPRHIRVGSR